mmetsp:Transcript_14812/g.44128  ORF Transcript_14812/g.44128 Transcript_14812/m.44128 type:complete len:128 (-) Transcript_14812:243-626(-)
MPPSHLVSKRTIRVVAAASPRPVSVECPPLTSCRFYDKLTHEEIKLECQSHGLPKTAAKYKLIAALQAHAQTLAHGIDPGGNQTGVASTPCRTNPPGVAATLFDHVDAGGEGAQSARRGPPQGPQLG